MAGRRPTRPTTDSTNNSATPQNFIHKIITFCKNERFCFALGIVLIIFTLYATLALISFFFTGKADFNIIESRGMEGVSVYRDIQNWTGVPGAYLTYFLMHNAFGIASLALYALFAIWGMHLTHIRRASTWRKFIVCLFLMLWGSTALAFLQHTLLGRFSPYFPLGGAHGEWLGGLLLTYTHAFGSLLILVAIALLFFVAIDSHSVEHFKAFGHWFTNLFKRKPKETPAEPEPIQEPTESPENIIKEDEQDKEQPATIILDGKDIISAPDGGDVIPDGGDVSNTPENTPESNFIVIKPTPVESPTEEPVNAPETPPTPEFGIAKTIETELDPNDPETILKLQGPYDPKKDLADYQFPATSLLKVYDNETRPVIDQEELIANKDRIVDALNSFGIEIQSIAATVGPTITLYEIVLKAGTKINKVQSLEKDLMAALSALGIRIIAPIPGKNAVGIEVPNKKPQIVSMHSVIASRKFQEEKDMALPVAIGKTITNEIFMFDLAKTPHLLVAGATGMGKSVGLNAILTSLLYKKHPAEMKLVLIDPKMVEFAPYTKLARHYLATIPGQEEPIITDSNKTIETLKSLVQEMEDRYRLLKEAGCRKLEEYNEKFINRRLNPEKGHRYMPYIVIVIDEFGDFIMVAGKEVERPIQRIAQKARAVGMHMILATQRPTVSIITGNIKANVPTRIAFRVQSLIDSRTVLDAKGAEQLVYKGDMLYSGDGKDPIRVQCAFVDTPEVEDILNHIHAQHGYGGISYELPEYVPEEGEGGAAPLAPGAVDLKHLDPMFTDVARYVVQTGQGGTTNLQRKFAIGFQKAGRLMDQLEAAGIVGPQNGSKPRQVLIQDEEELDALLHRLF